MELRVSSFLFLTVLLSKVTCSAQLSCFSCDLLQYPYECRYIKQCEQGERCYIERVETADNGFGWTQGCTNKCTPFANSTSSEVSDRVISVPSVSNIDLYQTKCRHCCDTDFCNRGACAAPELPSNDTRLHCYNCKDRSRDCDTVQLCEQDELCGFERGHTLYQQDHAYRTFTSSCKSKQECDSVVHFGFGCELTCCDIAFCNDRCNLTRITHTFIGRFCETRENFKYDKITDTCVRIGYELLNYSESERACAEDEADLVLLDSQKKFDYIKLLLSGQNDSTDFWAGAEKLPNVTYFRWTDGNTVDVHSTNWLRTSPLRQPDNMFTMTERCVYMDFRDRYLWHDANCSVKLDGYICEIITESEQQKLLQCRNLLYNGFYFDRSSNTCLKIVTQQQISWKEALQQCQQYRNGTLLALNLPHKLDIVFAIFFNHLINDTNYWIGGRASDLHPDQFSWTTGEQFSNMTTFKPLWGHADTQAHLSMVLDHKNNFRWSYRHVHEKYGYICEITKASLQKHQTTFAMTSSTTSLPVSSSKETSATWTVSSASQRRIESTTSAIKSPSLTMTSQHTESTQHKNDSSVLSTKVTERQTFPSSMTTGKKTRTTKYHPSTTAPTTGSTKYHPFTTAPTTGSTKYHPFTTAPTTGSTKYHPFTTAPTTGSTKYHPFTTTLTKTSSPLTASSADQSPSTTVIFTPVLISMETTNSVSSYTVNNGISTSREPGTITKQGTSSTKFQPSTLFSTSTTKRPPVTLPPVSTTCHVCSGPAMLCELLHAPVTCAPPNNYCMNIVENHTDGTRTVDRRCSNFDMCYREWWLGTSDKDKCRSYDQDIFLTMNFRCAFCCVKDKCNKRIRPPTETLYTDD